MEQRRHADQRLATHQAKEGRNQIAVLNMYYMCIYVYIYIYIQEAQELLVVINMCYMYVQMISL